MVDLSALVRPHAAAIIGALVEILDSPDGRMRLKAAELLLRWGWGTMERKCRGSEPVGASPASRLSAAEQRRMVDLLLQQIEPEPKQPNRSATSCPARHADARPIRTETPPGADLAINPMSLEPAGPAAVDTPGAEQALTPCPATQPVGLGPMPPPDPGTNPMSPERSLSPLAATPGTASPRRDADPMSRALLPARHTESAFRRRLAVPAPVEPPWVHGLHSWPLHRRKRWT